MAGWAASACAALADRHHGWPALRRCPASLLDDGCLRLEFHPTDEFPGEDPATLLPMALPTALAGLAHELRNPLAVALPGAAQLLARRIDDEELGRYVDVIRDEVQRLGSLLDRLLDPEQPRRRELVNDARSAGTRARWPMPKPAGR